jgi:hypothetical protein
MDSARCISLHSLRLLDATFNFMGQILLFISSHDDNNQFGGFLKSITNSTIVEVVLEIL